MSFCKYHPLQAATFYCDECKNHTCDQCSDEARRKSDTVCFLCGNKMQALGVGEHVEPFWRHFEQSFRYPVNSQALGLIIVLSLISAIAAYIPFGFVLYLVVAGIQLKYAFSCLKETANGNMQAPNVADAYSGGLILLFRFYFMIILAFAPVIGASMLFGYKVAALVSLLTLCALPAIVIIFAISDSIVESLNPLRTLAIISSIGLPYGLLLAIIMIMTGSVEVITAFIPEQMGLLGSTLQAFTTNFYTIVAFHIMGYMIFQYQDDMGFSASENYAKDQIVRSDSEKMLSYLDILVKEGEFELALQQYQKALKQFPTHDGLRHGQFELSLALADGKNAASIENLQQVTDGYLLYINQQQAHKLSAAYKRVQGQLANFIPSNPDIRLNIARACYQNGDSRSTVKLLNGLHKQYPNFRQLSAAFELMAKALEDIPNMQGQAEKARQLAAQYAAKPINDDIDYQGAEASDSAQVKATQASPRSTVKPVFETPEIPAEDTGKKDLPAIEFG